MPAPQHWAITNSSHGDDANSGIWDGSTLASFQANAKKTWQSLYDAMASDHVTNNFFSPQIIHISNHSEFVLSGAIAQPNGTDTAWYNSAAKGRAPSVYVPYEEDTSGLYHTFRNGVRHPSWKVDASADGRFTDSVYARPTYSYWSMGHITGISHSDGAEMANTYSQCDHMIFDASGQTSGNYIVQRFQQHVNCTFIGGDGAGNGSNYGVLDGQAFIGCRFVDFKNKSVWVNGPCTIRHCTFENIDVTASNLSEGCITITFPGHIEISNCTFIGQGSADGNNAIITPSYVGNVRIFNNIFSDIQYPFRVGTIDSHFTDIGVNGFYNCGQTTVIKNDPTDGITGGALFPNRKVDIILDEDPFVDSAGGDYRLKETSQARGRGQHPAFGAPSFENIPLVGCDLGAFAYGAPNLPQAGRFI